MANWFKGENFMRQSGSPSNNVNDFNSNTTEKVKVIDITKSVKDSTKQLNDFFKDARASVDKFNKYTYDQSVIYSKKIVKVYEKAYQDMFKNLGMQAEKQAQDAANKIKEASEPTAPNNKRNDETRAKSFGESIWDSFGKALKSYLNSWVQRFEKGVTNIVTAYNNTYDTVAALTQINQGIYRGQQRAIQSSIKAGGFERSVSISSVMTELNTVVTNGITDINTATEKAFNDVITKKISPYLETSTNAYTDLYMALGKDQFAIQMVGISSALTQIAGDSRVFKQTINNMLTQLTDVGMFARKQLFGKDVADAQAQLNYLVSKGELSSSQATDILDQAINIVRNPYSGGYGSGNVLARIATSKTSDTGLQNVGTVTRNLLSEYLWFTQQTAGTSNIGTAATASTLGLNGYIYGLTPQGVQQSFAAGQTASNNIKQYGTEQLTALANNSYTTETEQRDIMLENNSLTIAFAYQIFPSEMNAIKALLTSILGAVSLKGLFGGGSGGFNLMHPLASASSMLALNPSSYLSHKALAGQLLYGTNTPAGGLARLSFAQATPFIQGAGGLAEIGIGINQLSQSGQRTTASNIASGVGIAGGTAAIVGALAGSGPVGWVGLIAGAVGLGVSELLEQQKRNSKLYKSIDEKAQTLVTTSDKDSDIFDEILNKIPTEDEDGNTTATYDTLTTSGLFSSKELKKFGGSSMSSDVATSLYNQAITGIKPGEMSQDQQNEYDNTVFQGTKKLVNSYGAAYTKAIEARKGSEFVNSMSVLLGKSPEELANPKNAINWDDYDTETLAAVARLYQHYGYEFSDAEAATQFLTDEGLANLKYAYEMRSYLEAHKKDTAKTEIYYQYKDQLASQGWNVSGYANGLLEVPYNGFPAMLHEGERVLTAPEALEYRNMKFGAVTGNNYSIIIAAIEAVGNAVVSAIKGQPSNIASLEDDGVMRIGTNRISLSPVF